MDSEPEPVKEKNGFQEPRARSFLEGAGAESPRKKGTSPPTLDLSMNKFLADAYQRFLYV
jgi:hypothetical protein